MKKVLAVAIILALACTSVFALTISVGFSTDSNIVDLIKSIPEMDGIKGFSAYKKSHRAWTVQISGPLYEFNHEPISSDEQGVQINGVNSQVIQGTIRLNSEFGNLKKIGSLVVAVGYGTSSDLTTTFDGGDGIDSFSIYGEHNVNAGLALEFKDKINPKFVIGYDEVLSFGIPEIGKMQLNIADFNLGLILGKDAETGKFSIGTVSGDYFGIRPIIKK